MKHKILATVLFLTISIGIMAQKRVDGELHSTFTGGPVNYTVWLPENWSPKEQYTTIYTFSYGASDAEFIAQQIKYLSKLRIVNIPPTIVVSVKANMDRIGYNYETGLLTQSGMSMVKCLKSELFPLMEQQYKASKFRTYTGQSYGASYGNYLFLHQPELFSGYILISPERLSAEQPPFVPENKIVAFYTTRPTYYFLASGALDMDRRKEYTKEIAQTVKRLDSTQFNFQYHNLAEAGHNNSLAMGLPLALEFIYKAYNTFPERQAAEGLIQNVKRYEENVDRVYGILPQKTAFSTYQPLLQYIWQHQDTTGMREAIGYFINNESSGRQLRDFAYSCTIVGLKQQAISLYELAIKKVLKDEIQTNQGPSTLVTCYRELAKEMATNDPQKGWNLLQEGLKITLKFKNNVYLDYYPDIYFYLGQFAVNNNYKVAEGLKYLLIYEQERNDVVDIIHFSKDNLYVNIGKAYVFLKDLPKAKYYLGKAIEHNSKNAQAQELLDKISVH